MLKALPRRLIVLALIILFFAYLPEIYWLLSRYVFGGQSWWPQSLSDLPLAPALSRFWLVAYLNWQIVRVVGLAILAIGIVWALLRRSVELARQEANKPLTTSAVLLAEAQAIHGTDGLPPQRVKDGDTAFHSAYRAALTTDQSLMADLDMAAQSVPRSTVG